MRTEDLVDVLGRSHQPVDRAIVRRRFVMALLIGGACAVCVAIALLGTRPDLATARAVGFVAVKVGFGTAIFSLAAFYLVRIARPGGEGRVSLFVMAAPFLATVALAAAVLAGASPAHWDRMVMGQEWVECLVSIPLIAVAPFAAVIWAARSGGPRHRKTWRQPPGAKTTRFCRTQAASVVCAPAIAHGTTRPAMPFAPMRPASTTSHPAFVTIAMRPSARGGMNALYDNPKCG